MQQAIRAIKAHDPDFYVITDVCMCEYTSHGHCGILDDRGCVINDVTLEMLADDRAQPRRGRRRHGRAERHDGRPRRRHPRRARCRGLRGRADHGYAAKYASGYYGPFREAAESTPAFGDRRGYQMDPANAEEALREVALDIEEGADIVMVKPALAYMDIIRLVKDEFGYPTAAYNVSGEYAMVKAAAQKGWIDEQRVVLETLTGFKRAGASLILTYHAKDAARWLAEG